MLTTKTASTAANIRWSQYRSTKGETLTEASVRLQKPIRTLKRWKASGKLVVENKLWTVKVKTIYEPIKENTILTPEDMEIAKEFFALPEVVMHQETVTVPAADFRAIAGDVAVAQWEGKPEAPVAAVEAVVPSYSPRAKRSPSPLELELSALAENHVKMLNSVRAI
jgi:hypothetical protein